MRGSLKRLGNIIMQLLIQEKVLNQTKTSELKEYRKNKNKRGKES
jgi:hypothetical protein